VDGTYQYYVRYYRTTTNQLLKEAAGQFTARLRATKAQNLAASAIDSGQVVIGQRGFTGGDPTPDTRQVTVAMPPDVDFVNYEVGHVHPLALSSAGNRLYAVNTPESRLSVFNVASDGSLSFAGDVPVGLDPASVTVRPGTNEVWVVNHTSDTISIVNGVTRAPIATLAVGDEPNDVAFASGRAFVALAGKDDAVKVFDATSRAQLASLLPGATKKAGEGKAPEVSGLAGAKFHFIGHLQTNKSARAAELFHVLQTVDSAKLARPRRTYRW
jgi:YVTN family beta-propeller protein